MVVVAIKAVLCGGNHLRGAGHNDGELRRQPPMRAAAWLAAAAPHRAGEIGLSAHGLAVAAHAVGAALTATSKRIGHVQQ